MSENNNQPEVFSVPITQHDFGVIRASLQQSIRFWNHLVETGQYPNNFDEGMAKEIAKMSREVLEKVELILTMKPIPSHNVGVKSSTDG